MKEIFTIINNIKIYRYQLIDNHTQLKLSTKICVICGKEIKDCEKISLLANNNRLFPNVWIHDSHIINKYNAKLTIKYIIFIYNKYLSHTNERKIWEN